MKGFDHVRFSNLFAVLLSCARNTYQINCYQRGVNIIMMNFLWHLKLFVVSIYKVTLRWSQPPFKKRIRKTTHSHWFTTCFLRSCSFETKFVFFALNKPSPVEKFRCQRIVMSTLKISTSSATSMKKANFATIFIL